MLPLRQPFFKRVTLPVTFIVIGCNTLCRKSWKPVLVDKTLSIGHYLSAAENRMPYQFVVGQYPKEWRDRLYHDRMQLAGPTAGPGSLTLWS